MIQAVAVEADQVHSRAASTVTEPVPPEGPKLPVKPFTEIWHFCVVGPTREVDPELQAEKTAATASSPRDRPRSTGTRRLSLFRNPLSMTHFTPGDYLPG